MTQRKADKELIKPICENLRNLRIKENRKQSRLAKRTPFAGGRLPSLPGWFFCGGFSVVALR
jgi:hypothetical protein